MKKPSCHELGFCQALLECDCHVSCACPAPSRYPFAPGVIDGPDEPAKGNGWVIEAALVLVFLLALAAILGFLAGYFTLPGVQP